MTIGAVHGATGYLVVIAWMAGIHWHTVAFACIVGAVSGVIVSAVLRWRKARCADPPRWLPWALVGAPPCFLIAWLGLIWPAIGWFSPVTQYRFGGQASRDQAIMRVLSRVTVGDPYAELQRLLPHTFAGWELVGSFEARGGSSSIEYELSVQDGVITRLGYRSLARE